MFLRNYRPTNNYKIEKIQSLGNFILDYLRNKP